MSKKLIYLASFVLLLGLAVSVTGAEPLLQDPGPDGIVSVEAENFDENTPQGSYMWQFATDIAGFCGTGFMRAMPAGGGEPTGGNRNLDYVARSPRLDFEVNFIKTGTHYVWVRGYIIGGNDDSAHVGLDGEAPTSDRMQTGSTEDTWEWSNGRRENLGLATIDVADAGVHTINVWMREDGWRFDKIVLTTNPDYTPSGEGPPESDRSSLEKASCPKPANGQTDVPRDVVLSWMPGISAPAINGHKVYFSENFSDVNDGIDGVTQDASSYALPQRLDLGTTYYWRVDEVNGPPDYTVHQGKTWSFTTEPVAYTIENVTATASSSEANKGPENTVNGSGLDDSGLLHSKIGDDNMWLSSLMGPQPTWIEYEFDKVYKLHEMWVWNANETYEPVVGLGFKDVSIDYSVDGNDYTSLGTTHEFAQAPGADDYAHNTTVDLSGVTARYVRLTANSNFGGILNRYGLSEVRFFHIPVHAREPSPDLGATDVALDVILGWRAGREAAEHNVYVSTDQQAVIDGTAPVVTVAETSYGPLALDLGKTYYWRVDEVNEAQSPATWQGGLWSFTTQDHFVVDDFESYNDLDTTDPESNRIFLTWLDGYEVPTNGSLVGYENPPFCERTIVHGGRQSMPIFYSNTDTAVYSEAERTFAVPQDWTQAGAATLVLYFYGTEGNTGQLYVKVNGTKVVYGGDAGDIAKPQWNQWSIDLASLGVDLQSVTTLSIGIDGIGASGTLYFDDIWLSLPTIEPQAN